LRVDSSDCSQAACSLQATQLIAQLSFGSLGLAKRGTKCEDLEVQSGVNVQPTQPSQYGCSNMCTRCASDVNGVGTAVWHCHVLTSTIFCCLHLLMDSQSVFPSAQRLHPHHTIATAPVVHPCCRNNQSVACDDNLHTHTSMTLEGKMNCLMT
jgi:hypothetical protein